MVNESRLFQKFSVSKLRFWLGRRACGRITLNFGKFFIQIL